MLQPFLSGSHRLDPAVALWCRLACSSLRQPHAPASRKTKAFCICAPWSPPCSPTHASSALTWEGKGAEFLSCFYSRHPLRPLRQPPPASLGTGQPALGRGQGWAVALPQTSASGQLWMQEPQVGDAGGCGNAIPRSCPLVHHQSWCATAVAWVSQGRLTPSSLGLGLRNPQPCQGGDPNGTSVPPHCPQGHGSGHGCWGRPRHWAGLSGELGGP